MANKRQHKSKQVKKNIQFGGINENIDLLYPYWTKHISSDVEFITSNGKTYYKNDYIYAKDQKRLFKNIKISKLKDGFYTYVVSKSYDVVYGNVVSKDELGVKHINLAEYLKNNEIIMAGEMQKNLMLYLLTHLVEIIHLN